MSKLRGKLQSKLRADKSAGFTLTELIVVMVVIALIAAVAIPSMIGFIRHGQHMNRMNIARTLYRSMQTQLSRAVLEGNLRLVLTEDFYVGNTNELITNYRLADALGADFPPEDDDNREFVYYISKPAGYRPDSASATDATGKFYSLLDEVIINKEILDDAILMEFNVRTGVVMSIFYGDADGLWFQPGSGPDTNRRFDYGIGGINDVSGGRGMEGAANPYQNAFERRQGYFGVESTGVAADIQYDDIVNIFDGTVDPLDGRENILYAELLIPTNTDATGYALELIAEDRSSLGFDPIVEELLYDEMTLNGAIAWYMPLIHGELVYYAGPPRETIEQHGIDVTGDYDLFIWVLDCVFGDLTLNYDISIDRYDIFKTKRMIRSLYARGSQGKAKTAMGRALCRLGRTIRISAAKREVITISSPRGI